jgi:pSer/pThr/pTyr-binding forkhead associated (FHA) protein
VIVGTGSVQIEEVLLALKIGFLVLLYLFIWRIVRTAKREISVPQESMILSPEQARELRKKAGVGGRLVIMGGPGQIEGAEYTLDSAPVTAGRAEQNDIVLGRDEFASATHARFELRGSGAWIEDVGSTNGTYLNGVRLKKRRRLNPGDVVRVGETDIRYEK